MNTNEMRVALQKKYGGGDAWKKRVNKMSDQQVIAIYKRLAQNNKI